MPQQSRGDGAEQPGDGGDDLGANDELIAFKDEGEQEEEKRSAAGRDLDDLKTSLVRESETHCSGSQADRSSRAEAESERRAEYNQLLLQALRRQQDGGLLHPSPYVGYPFFMIPDLGKLCSPYLTSGALSTGGHTFLPFQWPLLDMQGGAAGRDATTPTQLTSNMVQHPHLSHLHPLLSYSPEAFSPQRASPALSPDTTGMSRTPHAACYPLSPGGVAQIPHPLGWLPSQPMYSLAGGFTPAALAMNASISSLMSGGFSPRLVTPPQSAAASTVTLPRGIKQEYEGSCSSSSSSIRQHPGRSREEEQPEREERQKVEKKPHIKKPLNAFMLYMRDERNRVISECNLKESATINQILGQRWHSLTKDEQSKYYDLARKERVLHSKLYPGWSARDNYGMKKKRKRMRSETALEAVASSPDLPLQLKRPHLASPRPALPHFTHSHLSQASPASSLDSPATPSAALSSPAAPAATRTDHTFDSDSASFLGEQLVPLALTTKPLSTLPSPNTPPSGPLPSPPPARRPAPNQSAGALTQPLSLQRANQQ